jgi:O-antigen/teichoic acid export membrane protein
MAGQGARLSARPAGRLGAEFGGTLVSTLLPAVAGVVSGIALARTLEPLGRGEYASLLIWPLMFSLLGDLGVGFALTYHAGREPERKDALWTLGLAVAFGWGVLASGAAAALLPPLLQISAAGRTGLRLAFAAVPFAILSHLHTCLLLGLGRLRASNMIRSLQMLLYAGLVGAVAFLGAASVLRYAVAWAAAQVAVGLGSLAYLALVCRVRPRWDHTLVSPVLAYGMRVYVGGFAAQATLRLDQVLMSAMGLIAPLGIYAVAVAVASGAGPVFTALAVVVLHRAARTGTGADPSDEIRRVLRLTVLVGLPLVGAGIVLAPVVVPLVFGEPYRPSVLPAQVLLAAAFFQGANAILGNGLRAVGRPGRSSVAEAIGCVATIALLLVLLPRFGALGAAVASLAAYAAVTVLQFRYLSAASGVRLREVVARS